MSSSPGGFTGAQLREREETARDLAPMNVKCALCAWPGFSGTAKECRAEAEHHRAMCHPEAKRTVRRTHHPSKIRQREMDDEERALIEYERRRRAKITGVDLSNQPAIK